MLTRSTKKFTVLLALFLSVWFFSSSVFAVSFYGEGQQFCLWSYSPFTSKVTERKLQPFVEALSNKLQRKVRLDASNDNQLLHEAASQGKVDMVIVPLPMAQTLSKDYGYQAVAVFDMDSHLFVRPEKRRASLTSLKRIGVIANTTTQRFAANELSSLIPELELISYGNLFEIINSFNRDNLDAFATIKGTVSVHIDALGEQYVSRYQFKKVARGVILISPDLSDVMKENVESFVFSETSGMKAFTRAFGFEGVEIKAAGQNL